MRTYPLYIADAFTDVPLAGNACTVILDAVDITPAECLAIARELNQAETAFVAQIRDGIDGLHARVRYFTPAEEIPFAGHPTVATAAVLATVHTAPLESDRRMVFELRDFVLPITVSSQSPGEARTRVPLPRPAFLRSYSHGVVADAFSLDAADLIPHAPAQTVSAGTPQLMVPVRDHDALRRATLAPAKYAALHARGDFFSPHLFCLGGMTTAGDTSARHFGIPPDLPEDPVTGSGTAAMAAYLWAHRLIPNPSFVAEQGHWMGRPGRIDVEVIGSRNDIRGVTISGTAVVISEGRFFL